jgi:hypothetical protein
MRRSDETVRKPHNVDQMKSKRNARNEKLCVTSNRWNFSWVIIPIIGDFVPQ